MLKLVVAHSGSTQSVNYVLNNPGNGAAATPVGADTGQRSYSKTEAVRKLSVSPAASNF